mmetsp:Transcript_11565/g.10486  ORF Transcript_11565/g.10486 Transcript_11565/m.10486 type:complete len:356 (+) Transcript_11565:134-1201(+)
MFANNIIRIKRIQLNHFQSIKLISNNSISIKSNIWSMLRYQAEDMLKREPLLKPLIEESILQHRSFADALIYRLATKFAGKILTSSLWINVFNESLHISKSLGDEFDIERLAMEDLIAVEERDPACRCIAQAFLYFKGFKSIQSHRFAHILWISNRKDLALVIQARNSEVFGVDIHPGANIKGGLMVDHATGVVIGETATVGRNCSMLHGVTLGGTGNEIGDRHPKIGNNVLIGCQATILGNITIGDNSKIGSGSMILKSLFPGTTAVGNPCRILNIDNNDVNHDIDKLNELNDVSLFSITKRVAHVNRNYQIVNILQDKGIKTWTNVWIPKVWPDDSDEEWIPAHMNPELIRIN